MAPLSLADLARLQEQRRYTELEAERWYATLKQREHALRMMAPPVPAALREKQDQAVEEAKVRVVERREWAAALGVAIALLTPRPQRRAA